jgi:YggT family protein
MIYALVNILDLLLSLATWIIIGSVIVSWLIAFNVLNTHQPFARNLVLALEKMTEPLYRPVRKILPDFGGLDFSPIVVLLAISILRRLLGGVVLEMGPTLT